MPVHFAVYFVYSRHSTRARAVAALEDYLASGIVSEGERPHIERQGSAWCVMFMAAGGYA